MIVVDASVIVLALADDGDRGDAARARLGREAVLTAPELLDLEVLSVLRRHAAARTLTDRRAALALTDLADLPLRRVPHRSLLRRCWELRGNLTTYDAAYVALAETLETTLLTADGGLSRAPGPRCPIELMS